MYKKTSVLLEDCFPQRSLCCVVVSLVSEMLVHNRSTDRPREKKDHVYENISTNWQSKSTFQIEAHRLSMTGLFVVAAKNILRAQMEIPDKMSRLKFQVCNDHYSWLHKPLFLSLTFKIEIKMWKWHEMSIRKYYQFNVYLTCLLEVRSINLEQWYDFCAFVMGFCFFNHFGGWSIVHVGPNKFGGCIEGYIGA